MIAEVTREKALYVTNRNVFKNVFCCLLPTVPQCEHTAMRNSSQAESSCLQTRAGTSTALGSFIKWCRGLGCVDLLWTPESQYTWLQSVTHCSEC